MNGHVWIVEMWNDERKRFEPTVGVAITRYDGRITLQDWRDHNPADKLRLVRYVSAAYDAQPLECLR